MNTRIFGEADGARVAAGALSIRGGKPDRRAQGADARVQATTEATGSVPAAAREPAEREEPDEGDDDAPEHAPEACDDDPMTTIAPPSVRPPTMRERYPVLGDGNCVISTS